MGRKTVIRAGWLVDGSGGPARKDMALVMENGRFTSIGPFAAAVPPEDNELLDLSHATVLPPLIDSHLHLAMSGTMDSQVRERLRRASCPELEPVIEVNLDQLANFGVRAVRDGGDRDGCVAVYLAATADNRHVRVQTPGRALHRQGRYGALIGHAPEFGQSLLAAWRRQADLPWIKLVNSGLNSLKTYGRETEPQFSIEEMRELVLEAGRYGKRVMVHANGERPVREAIAAGCHSIEHGFFMGRDNLARMADSGCVWVPTAITMKAYADILAYQGEMEMSAVARRNLDHQLEQLRLARELGVTVALGTDAGSPGVLHGESVFEEMKLMARAGYPLAEIVMAATSTAADLLGLEGEGRIAPGRKADFILARGTPAQLPRKLSYLEGIYLSGLPAPYYRKNPEKHVTVGR